MADYIDFFVFYRIGVSKRVSRNFHWRKLKPPSLDFVLVLS